MYVSFPENENENQYWLPRVTLMLKNEWAGSATENPLLPVLPVTKWHGGLVPPMLMAGLLYSQVAGPCVLLKNFLTWFLNEAHCFWSMAESHERSFEGYNLVTVNSECASDKMSDYVIAVLVLAAQASSVMDSMGALSLKFKCTFLATRTRLPGYRDTPSIRVNSAPPSAWHPITSSVSSVEASGPLLERALPVLIEQGLQ